MFDTSFTNFHRKLYLICLKRMLSLEATHKRISSEIADIFRYFLNPLPHSSLADLAKKKFKSLIVQHSIRKMPEC